MSVKNYFSNIIKRQVAAAKGSNRSGKQTKNTCSKNKLLQSNRIRPQPVFALLSLLSLPYLIVIKVRLFLYKIFIFKTNRLKCPVISVGNLTLGGTGKTPVVEYIARFFIQKELNPVVLSRGYGRSPQTNIAVISNGKKTLLKQEEAGDEPYLLAKNNPSLPIIVGKNRFQAGETAIKKFQPDVIILDDGFQHLSLARDLNIVLVNCTRPLENEHIFPAGFLREPVSALKRADIILFTHSDDLPESQFNNLSFINKDVIKLKTIHDFEKIICLNDSKVISPEELNKKNIVVFCGIGDPDSFKKKIEQYGAEVVYFKFYPDHYIYTSADIQFINKTAERLKADFILTTQKDGVKIKEMLSSSSLIWVVHMKIEFREGEERFQEMLLSLVLQTS